MANWLLKEEPEFPSSYPVLSGSGAVEADYTILLKRVRIIDNKKMFGRPENILLYCIIVNGYQDMQNNMPFWSQQLQLPAMKDGDIRSFDDGGESGLIVFHGKPLAFINLYIIAFKDRQDTRQFAENLKNSFLAQGIGIVAEQAFTIFAGSAGTMAAKGARDATAKAIDSTLDHYKNMRNPILDVYYGSLLRSEKFRVGLHPIGYNPTDSPPKMLNCGGVLELAYEVQKSYE